MIARLIRQCLAAVSTARPDALEADTEAARLRARRERVAALEAEYRALAAQNHELDRRLRETGALLAQRVARNAEIDDEICAAAAAQGVGASVLDRVLS